MSLFYMRLNEVEIVYYGRWNRTFVMSVLNCWCFGPFRSKPNDYMNQTLTRLALD